MPSIALVWFRCDLRVHDHPGLTAAYRECDRVVPVFVLEPRLLAGRFPSRNRAWFLHGCLAELRAALRDRGAMYNPMTQQRRHDPDGEYVRRWVPELRSVPDARLAEPWTMSADEQHAAGR